MCVCVRVCAYVCWGSQHQSQTSVSAGSPVACRSRHVWVQREFLCVHAQADIYVHVIFLCASLYISIYLSRGTEQSRPRPGPTPTHDLPPGRPQPCAAGADCCFHFLNLPPIAGSSPRPARQVRPLPPRRELVGPKNERGARPIARSGTLVEPFITRLRSRAGPVLDRNWGVPRPGTETAVHAGR